MHFLLRPFIWLALEMGFPRLRELEPWLKGAFQWMCSHSGHFGPWCNQWNNNKKETQTLFFFLLFCGSLSLFLMLCVNWLHNQHLESGFSLAKSVGQWCFVGLRLLESIGLLFGRCGNLSQLKTKNKNKKQKIQRAEKPKIKQVPQHVFIIQAFDLAQSHFRLQILPSRSNSIWSCNWTVPFSYSIPGPLT